MLSGVTEKVKSQLMKAHFDQVVGTDNICPHINVALKKAEELVESL